MDSEELRVEEASETFEFVRDIESSFDPKSGVSFDLLSGRSRELLEIGLGIWG